MKTSSESSDLDRSVSVALVQRIRQDLALHEGWISFERFMHLALYTPALGFYTRDRMPVGLLPKDGSDFVTAPELSRLFGHTLARQVGQVLSFTRTDQILEFGAGSGALAEQVLDALGEQVGCYAILEVSATLRARQKQRLARFGSRIQWLNAWPQTFEGVILANEVLDAMPPAVLRYDGKQWLERGVSWQDDELVYVERPTAMTPPGLGPWPAGMVTEVHRQAQAFIRSLAERLTRGLVLIIDYGFPQDEYYHPQRMAGTLMCHRAHRSDDNPLIDVGLKDITVHLDFTALALAAQDSGLDVAGYTSQARFLLNCGLVQLLEHASPAQRAQARLLISEHEMGELFKVLALSRCVEVELLGFSQGDRTHRL